MCRRGPVGLSEASRVLPSTPWRSEAVMPDASSAASWRRFSFERAVSSGAGEAGLGTKVLKARDEGACRWERRVPGFPRGTVPAIPPTAPPCRERFRESDCILVSPMNVPEGLR